MPPGLPGRLLCAIIGFLGGALLSLFTVLPLAMLIVRFNVDLWWLVPVAPLAFALIVALCSFIGREQCFNALTDWWDDLLGGFPTR